MKRLGIVLAAGASIRLPMKCLLPDRQGRPILLNSFDFCRRHCSAVTVVHDGGPVKWWLDRHFGLTGGVWQDGASGVCSAIRFGVLSQAADEYLITFADNVYDGVGPPSPGCASIREPALCGPSWRELDAHQGEWIDRVGAPDSACRLAGWVCLRSKQALRAEEYRHLIGLLNGESVEPKVCHSTGWHDVGTPESYRRYLESI